MGLCASCCRPSSSVITPDVATRRQQQIEAAERRLQAEQARGIKDVEKVKRMQQRSEEIEKKEAALKAEGGPSLKVGYVFIIYKFSGLQTESPTVIKQRKAVKVKCLKHFNFSHLQPIQLDPARQLADAKKF